MPQCVMEDYPTVKSVLQSIETNATKIKILAKARCR